MGGKLDELVLLSAGNGICCLDGSDILGDFACESSLGLMKDVLVNDEEWKVDDC